MHDRAKRIKYIRVLEKFFKQNISLLRLENFDFNLYQQRVNKNFQDLQKNEAAELNSNYLVELKRHIDNVMYFVNSKTSNIEESRQQLLKEANQILKNKNQSSYKKDKYKHKKFDDEY